MKKLYMKMLSVLFTGLIGISAYAQGTWKADSTIAAINASTEIPLAITGLTCMHSDATTVVGKPDKNATTVEYNGITYDNLAMIQGSTNDMYYAFRPAQDGTLDISVKMGSAKRTFILELTDACPDNANLAALTTNIATGGGITGTPAYFTTPSVYDTYHATNGTWDGSTAMQETGTNVYMVMSFPVVANKTYVAGCFGSKMMLRGVNYITATTGLDNFNTIQSFDIFPNPAAGSVIVRMDKSTEIGIYNTVGLLLKQQLVTASDNNVDIRGLEPGVYFIRDMSSKNKAQKLIIK